MSLEVLEAYDFRMSRRKTKYMKNFYRQLSDRKCCMKHSVKQRTQVSKYIITIMGKITTKILNKKNQALPITQFNEHAYTLESKLKKKGV